MYDSDLETQRLMAELKVEKVDHVHQKFGVRYEDNVFMVKAMPFMPLTPKPESIHCVVYINEERINIIVDIFYYLKKAYKVGDVGEFEVKTIYPTFYELRDANGFSGSLKRTNKLNLYQHQKVRCQVYQIDLKRLRVIYMGTDNGCNDTSRLSVHEVKSYFKQDEKWDVERLARLLIHDNMDDCFEEECLGWLQTMEDVDLLKCMQEELSRFMERSDFLIRRKEDERELFEQRLAQILHLSEIYLKAKGMDLLPIDDAGSSLHFVGHLLDKLRISGYLYHAEEQFDVMLCIFRINEALMKESVPLLLNVMVKHQEAHWKNEPFRTLLVRTLELYIRRMDEKIYLLYENDAETIENMVRALFVQRLLAQAGDEMITNDVLNAARLFRYLSYIKIPRTWRTLDRAYEVFYCNMEVNLHYTLEDTKNPVTLAHKLMNTETAQNDIYESYKFDNDRTRMLVDGHRIVVEPSHCYRPCSNQLPAHLFEWKDIQVRVPDSVQKPLKGSDYIPAFERMWNDISHSLFQKMAAAPKVTRKLNPGEVVQVYVYKKDDFDSSMVHCHVLTEDFKPTDVKGIMRVWPNSNGGNRKNLSDTIVGYYFPLNIEQFISDVDGHPYILDAQYVERDEFDRPIFRMRNLIEDYINEEFYTYQQEVVCMITDNHSHSGYSAISEQGVSFWIQNLDHTLDLKVNDVVRVEYLRRGDKGYAWGKHIETLDVPPISITKAFHKLMEIWSFNDTYNAELEGQEDINGRMDDDNDLMAQQDAAETMLLMGRKAALADTYVEAYNYLAFARLLAQMLEREEDRTYYNGRMKLILILHDFAVNGSVNKEEMDKLGSTEGSIFDNESLHNEFDILKTISYLNHPEQNATLWNIYSTTNKERLKKFASLVLANNLLESKEMSRQIQIRIKEALSLEDHDSSLKNYGVENTTTEFKTTIVFPPNNQMFANPEEQMQNIGKVVAAFLNTDGGNIYIGVNDQGTGVGIANDLNYKEFLRDKDKYVRFIQTQLLRKFDKLAMEHVTIAFDESYKERDVCIISVRPYLKGVKWEGIWYVRQNSRRISYSAKEFEEHNRLRQNRWSCSENETGEDIEHTDSQTIKTESNTDNDITPKRTNYPEILINRNRTEDHEMEVEGFINLTNDGEYARSDYEMGDVIVSMPYYVTDQWLLLIYDDGRVAKINLDKIREKQEFRFYKYNATKRLRAIFRTSNNCKLLSNFKARKKEWLRIDSLDVFTETDMCDEGQLLEDSCIDAVITCAIVNEEEAARFKKAQNLGANSFDMSHSEGAHNREMLKLLGISQQ